MRYTVTHTVSIAYEHSRYTVNNSTNTARPDGKKSASEIFCENSFAAWGLNHFMASWLTTCRRMTFVYNTVRNSQARDALTYARLIELYVRGIHVVQLDDATIEFELASDCTYACILFSDCSYVLSGTKESSFN